MKRPGDFGKRNGKSAQRCEIDFDAHSPTALDAWRGNPPAVASDSMNRGQFVAASIKPVATTLVRSGKVSEVVAATGARVEPHDLVIMVEPAEA